MLSHDDVERMVGPLPGVVESTHFGLPAFKVGDKTVIVLQAGATHAIVHVDQHTASTMAAEDPDACELVWRNQTRFVGLRVDLARVTPDRFEELAVAAWRHRAPRLLVKAYDADDDTRRPLPAGLGAPATRALETAGITTLADLRRWARADVAGLRGVGPKAMRVLNEAMQQTGLTFADEDLPPPA